MSEGDKLENLAKILDYPNPIKDYVVFQSEIIEYCKQRQSFDKLVEWLTFQEAGLKFEDRPPDEYFDLVDILFRDKKIHSEVVDASRRLIKRQFIEDYNKKTENKTVFAFADIDNDLQIASLPGTLLVTFVQLYDSRRKSTSPNYCFSAVGFFNNRKEHLIPLGMKRISKNQIQHYIGLALDEYLNTFDKDPARVELVVVPRDMLVTNNDFVNMISQKAYRNLRVILSARVSREMIERYNLLQINPHKLGDYFLGSVKGFNKRKKEDLRRELDNQKFVYIPFDPVNEDPDELVDYIDFLTFGCAVPIIVFIRNAKNAENSLEKFFDYAVSCCRPGAFNFLQAVAKMRVDYQRQNFGWSTIELISHEDLYEKEISDYIGSNFRLKQDSRIIRPRQRF